MKYNLIFTGLSETEGEHTEHVLRSFIKSELRINYFIQFGNVHRFGKGARPGKRGRPRPILARFIYHRDLANVLSSTYRLKGKPYGVNRQFPEVIEQARRVLYPIAKAKRAEGCTVQLERDVLWVNGDVYNPEDDTNVKTPETSRRSYARTATPDQQQENKRRRMQSGTQRKR